MSKQLNSVIKKIKKQKVNLPPSPWKKVAYISIGGLRSVGFDRESHLLLVVSSQGRGVIDCLTGEKLSRDHADYYDLENYLEAEGIGPLKGKIVRVAGLFGGGLPQQTEDGWFLENVTLEWPNENILLVEPGSSLYGSTYEKPDVFHKIACESEIRALGFSYTGRVLIMATTSDIAIYARPEI